MAAELRNSFPERCEPAQERVDADPIAVGVAARRLAVEVADEADVGTVVAQWDAELPRELEERAVERRASVGALVRVEVHRVAADEPPELRELALGLGDDGGGV